MEDSKDVYKTTDIYLASALILNGAELVSLEKGKSLRKQIIFVLGVPNMEWEKIVSEFSDNTLLVEAKPFVETFKLLKQKMFIELNSY